jgi:hypothetical protein
VSVCCASAKPDHISNTSIPIDQLVAVLNKAFLSQLTRQITREFPPYDAEKYPS